MEAVLALLTPETIDVIISSYGGLAEWIAQTPSLTPTTHSVVTEDFPL